MNEKSAARAFDEEIGAVLPLAPEQVTAVTNDVPDAVQIAGALRFLGAEWGRRTPSSLRHTVALLAEQAGGSPRATVLTVARRRVLPLGLAATAAAILLILFVPAARGTVARQISRVLAIVQVGPDTEIVRPDAQTPGEVAATLQQHEQQLTAGQRWHVSTRYVGVGGTVPLNASAAVQRVDRLELLRSLTSMTIQVPTVAHRGRVPAFNHALVAPDGLLLLFFGSDDDELLLMQARVGGGRAMGHSRVVMGTDRQGRWVSETPELKTEELLLDGLIVVWDPDNTGRRPDSSALRWESESVSYSLMGRALTRDEAVQLFVSLRPVDAQ
jgi:hypothetical protein